MCMVLCNGLRMSFVSARAGFLEKERVVNTDRSVFKTNGTRAALISAGFSVAALYRKHNFVLMT